MDIENTKPLYSIAVAAELSGSSPRMLREYEKAGFIKPARINGQRRFSNNDIRYIRNILFYLEEVGMTITGLKLLYMITPCWQIKQCGQSDCPAHGNFTGKCWDIAEDSDSEWRLRCGSCPIFLTYQKNNGMKIHQNPSSIPHFYSAWRKSV